MVAPRVKAVARPRVRRTAADDPAAGPGRSVQQPRQYAAPAPGLAGLRLGVRRPARAGLREPGAENRGYPAPRRQAPVSSGPRASSRAPTSRPDTGTPAAATWIRATPCDPGYGVRPGYGARPGYVAPGVRRPPTTLPQELRRPPRLRRAARRIADPATTRAGPMDTRAATTGRHATSRPGGAGRGGTPSSRLDSCTRASSASASGSRTSIDRASGSACSTGLTASTRLAPFRRSIYDPAPGVGVWRRAHHRRATRRPGVRRRQLRRHRGRLRRFRPAPEPRARPAPDRDSRPGPGARGVRCRRASRGRRSRCAPRFTEATTVGP